MSLHIVEQPGVGAEIHGVDLRNLDDDDFREVYRIFAEEGLVLFRNQAISEGEHMGFAERFGEINVNRFFQAHDSYPRIAMVVKEPEQAVNIGGGWHTDHSYDVEPALGSILVARELPTDGGDTWFTSMYKAYDALSEGLQQTLLGLRAVHSAKHVFGSGSSLSERTGGRFANAEAADALKDAVHPVVIKHPLSGRKALYVNPGFTLRFEGWTVEESRPLLEHLYAIATDEVNITKFEWKAGSIAFWDNRATWHFARNDYHGQRRVMHRITVQGCPLTAAVSPEGR